MFQIGKAVIHPLHGLGYVEGIEEKEILGKSFVFAVVEFENLQVMVNTNNGKSPLRPAISEKEVGELMDYLESCRPVVPSNHNERYHLNCQLLQEGSPRSLCQVLKGLLILEQSRKLSPRDSKLLERSLKFLSQELSHALSHPVDLIQEKLYKLAAGCAVPEDPARRESWLQSGQLVQN